MGEGIQVAAWGAALVEEDVLGAPCMVFAQRRTHLGDLLIDGQRFADREYLVQGGRRVTFGDHERAVACTAELLRSRGVGRGDPVLLFGANSIEWVIGFWAIIDVGAVVVLGNAWWSVSEMQHAIEVCRPALVLADERRAADLPASPSHVTFDVITAAVTDAPDLARPVGRDGAEDDPAVILFTSGTTGLPKGATLSHRGLIAVLQSLLAVTRRLPRVDRLPPPSRSLLSLPLFHVGGLQQIITPMASGGALVFTDGRFDPAQVIDLLRTEEVAVWSAVPTMVARVLDHLQAAGDPGLPGVRTVGMGGSPVPQHLRDRVLAGFPNAGRGTSVTYGLSEASGVVATGAGDELRLRVGTVGKPLPISTITIDEPDETGTGEILVRSPAVMLGYWAVEPAQQPITADRWLRTGDIGRLDEDGYLYVTDRSKDIVIRGGENIATPHVENRLLSHPAVAEVAVVGLPHATLGEELGAAIVLRPGATVDQQELATYAAAELAYFEVPTRWRLFAEPLPKNTTGKILKRAVRQQWIDDDTDSKETTWASSTAG